MNNKYSCKISYKNSERFPEKLANNINDYFFCRSLYSGICRNISSLSFTVMNSKMCCTCVSTLMSWSLTERRNKSAWTKASAGCYTSSTVDTAPLTHSCVTINQTAVISLDETFNNWTGPLSSTFTPPGSFGYGVYWVMRPVWMSSVAQPNFIEIGWSVWAQLWTSKNRVPWPCHPWLAGGGVATTRIIWSHSVVLLWIERFLVWKRGKDGLQKNLDHGDS